jgi:hypothetical protein
MHLVHPASSPDQREPALHNSGTTLSILNKGRSLELYERPEAHLRNPYLSAEQNFFRRKQLPIADWEPKHD